jgi:hypothetical protein
MPTAGTSGAVAAVAGLGMLVSPALAFAPSAGLRASAGGPRLSSVASRPGRVGGGMVGLSMSEGKSMDDAVAKSKAELESLMGAAGGDSKKEINMPESKVSVQATKAKPQKPKELSLEPKPFEDPDRTKPPNSFAMCVEQAFISTKAAIDDGKKLIEVEFPPLPQSALDNGALGADVILDAQISHSRQMARYFGNKKVAIVFADIIERNRFLEDTSFGGKSAKMKEDKREKTNHPTTHPLTHQSFALGQPYQRAKPTSKTR